MVNFNPESRHDLYNESLKPVSCEEKKTSPFGMGVIWFGMGVQISAFISLSPLLQYYTVGEIALSFAIGFVILILLGTLIWDIGLKYGISFATSIASCFGPVGGRIVGLLRIIPSFFFFGISGYLGAAALNEVCIMLTGYANIWLWIIINAALLVYATVHGIKGVEFFAKLATPLLLVVMAFLSYSIFTRYNLTIGQALSLGRTTGNHKNLMYGICVTVGGFTTVVMGMNDYGKDIKISEEEIKAGWWVRNRKPLGWSLLFGAVGYTFISSLAMVCVSVTGLTNPLALITEMMSDISIVLAILVQLFIFCAQFSTNLGANIYPAIYVISGLFPKYISTKTAAIGFGIIAIALRTWTLSGIDAYMNVFASTAGPVLGIVFVDYYILRKTRLSVDDLYQTHGKYYYWKGFNLPAFITYVMGTAVAFLIPDYGFFVATALSGVIYYFLATAFSLRWPMLVKED